MPVACYCYSCLLGSGPGSKCEKTFTLMEFKDWKHATVCCLNMIPAVFTENQLFHGINIKLIQNVKHPFQIGLELVDLNKLHKIDITLKHLLKLFSYCM